MAGYSGGWAAGKRERGISDLTVLFSRPSGSARSLVFRAVLVAEYCCGAMRGRLPYSHTYYEVRGTRPIGHESDIEAVGRAHRAWPADERARGVSAVRSCGDDCRAQVHLKCTASKKLVAPEARGRQQACCLIPTPRPSVSAGGRRARGECELLKCIR
jgi:hypothetical protein